MKQKAIENVSQVRKKQKKIERNVNKIKKKDNSSSPWIVMPIRTCQRAPIVTLPNRYQHVPYQLYGMLTFLPKLLQHPI